MCPQLPDGGGQLVIDTANPASGEQVKCHNAQRNFYNAEHCTLSTLPTACAANTKPTKVIVLNDANIEGIRDATSLPLYYVTGLELSTVYDVDSGFHAPCADNDLNQWSRWMKDTTDTVCENVANLGTSTIKIYQDMIEGTQNVGDRNHDIIDANRQHQVCDVADQPKTYLGKVVAYDGSCWYHVHPAEMNVVDLSGVDGSLYSTGGNAATFASTEEFETTIASSHTVIGKYGDHVEITSGDNTLPSPLNQTYVQGAYSILEYNPASQPILMCGSPNEIASDPWQSDHGFDVPLPEPSAWSSMSVWEYSGQKHTVWTHLALHAPDQLRQKMAWSLSQIVSVGLRQGRKAHDVEDTETYLAFYDMFVKNGFGNYRDLMREFSFSVIMANWLSFVDNRSLQYNLDKDGIENYPDENFAREILQVSVWRSSVFVMWIRSVTQALILTSSVLLYLHSSNHSYSV